MSNQHNLHNSLFPSLHHDHRDLATVNHYKKMMSDVMKFENFPGRNPVDVFEQVCAVIPENFPTKAQMRTEMYNMFRGTIIYHSLLDSWSDLADILEKYLDDVNEPWI